MSNIPLHTACQNSPSRVSSRSVGELLMKAEEQWKVSLLASEKELWRAEIIADVAQEWKANIMIRHVFFLHTSPKCV